MMEQKSYKRILLIISLVLSSINLLTSGFLLLSAHVPVDGDIYVRLNMENYILLLMIIGPAICIITLAVGFFLQTNIRKIGIALISLLSLLFYAFLWYDTIISLKYMDTHF